MSGDLEKRIAELEAECARLRGENRRLQALVGELVPVRCDQQDETASPAENMDDADGIVTQASPSEQKITLFRSLFRGRQDIYPLRWESRKGRSGYSPACANEWDRQYCGKPKTKCSECPNRKLLPITDALMYDHLTGTKTVGVYPLLEDETCHFLTCDFDKEGWQNDALSFLETCGELGVHAAMERSRSGNGAHVWIFFDEAISARTARKLGAAILTRTMQRRPEIGFSSYDRFFPNQDTMPKGGFGNLIALPLQGGPRKAGNSVFIDNELRPFPDQWRFLSEVSRNTREHVENNVSEAESWGDVTGLGRGLPLFEAKDDDKPWLLPPSGKKEVPEITGPLPKSVEIILSNLVFIEKTDLPPALINLLMRLAAFRNPEFYKAQAMRLPTFDKPRIISCTNDFKQHIGLPRGCFDQVLELLKEHGVEPSFQEERYTGEKIGVSFLGKLRPQQKAAAKALTIHDTGLLCAATAFGKTVVAADMIARRGVNTLILVHRRHLLEQWRERLAAFLDIQAKEIGQIGGGKRRPTGKIDIAIIQSLNRKGKIDDLVADYGHVIVDEAHHLSAFSFEQVMKQVKARYVLGLTATLIRKDGHHPIILMQCGPVRYQVKAKDYVKQSRLQHRVITRRTKTRLPDPDTDLRIHELYRLLVEDEERNNLIFNDVLKALEEGRSPLLLTERTDHLVKLSERLEKFAKNVIVLRGGQGRKQMAAIAERMAAIPDTEERILVATGRYIGEGFDDPRLDTLFLTLPISWKGTLQQYAGRLHRRHDNKKDILVYDYADLEIPMLASMYARRLSGYRAMGYEITQKD